MIRPVLIAAVGWLLLGAASLAPAATVTVSYITPGDGFDSTDPPDPNSPAPGATLGQQRRNSFEAAAAAWGSKLTSNITIVVEAQMVPLTCDAVSAVLGSAGTTFIFRDFANAPRAATWYHSALADKLEDVELNPGPGDVGATFNSDIDNNNACLNGVNWIYDTVYQAPAVPGTISFYDVVLHEIGHGVGVSTFVNLSNGARLANFDDIYMVFLEDHTLAGGGFTWPQFTDFGRFVSATNGPDVHWIGPAVQAMVNTGFLTGGVNGGHAMVYAPSPLELGSSISHWDTTMQDNTGTSEIMEPFAVPGADFLLTDQMLEDIGWGPVMTVPVTLAGIRSRKHAEGVHFQWITSTEAGAVGFNLLRETDGGWEPINKRLIPTGGDSLAPRNYEMFIPGVDLREFFVESLDFDGRTRRFGPFPVGQRMGRPPEPIAVDWAGINREHQEKQQQRRMRAKSVSEVVLEVNRSGLYRLDYESLAAAGQDLLGVSADDIAVLRDGEPVSRHVIGDGVFGPGSAIDFYGEAVDSLYTRTNIYQVVVDPASSKPATVDSSQPEPPDPKAVERAIRAVDDDREYSFSSPNGDPWFLRQLLSSGSPTSAAWTLETDHLVAGNARLRVQGWGVTDFDTAAPDHHLVVAVNGAPVLDRWLDGREIVDETIDLTLDPSNGELYEVRFELPGDAPVDFDLVNVESMSLEFDRRLIATGDYYEFQVRAGTGPVVTALDDDVVFGVSFESAARAAFQVDDVPVENPVIYSVGGDGLMRYEGATISGPAGDQQLVIPGGDSHQHFIVAASDALMTPRLIAHSDPPRLPNPAAEYLIIAHPDFVDAIQPLAQFHQSRGLVVDVVEVTDLYRAYSGGVVDPLAIRDAIRTVAKGNSTRFVLLVGGDSYDYLDHLGLGSISFVPTMYAPTHEVVTYSPSDPLLVDLDDDAVPDLALGRLPVRSNAELQAAVDKILDYPNADHQSTALFAADQQEPGTSFSGISDLRISQLPAGWQVETAYLDDLGVSVAHDRLMNGLNQGVALSHYFGHSGPSNWTFSGLFNASDAMSLTNVGRPTVMVQWGCWNTYYVDPHHQTLAHALMLSGDQGAAAVLGAATLTRVTSDKLLGGLLMPRMTVPGASLGEALRDAKQELSRTRPDLRDVILGWTLLGDPAQMLAPQSDP